MPIYEYHCSSCGINKEVLQKMSDPVLTTCPECGKETFFKQLSAPGFQLKGSGWYATDFRNSGAKPAAKSPDAAKSDSKSSSDAKPAASDAKPAASDAKPAASSTKPTPTGDAS